MNEGGEHGPLEAYVFLNKLNMLSVFFWNRLNMFQFAVNTVLWIGLIVIVMMVVTG